MAKFILSAFADEIDPDPQKQVDMLKQCGIRHVELRSVNDTNILDLNAQQVDDLKALLDKEEIKVSALGSPIGKIPIDKPFGPHLAKFRQALDLCKKFETANMRIFSYYLPGKEEEGDWSPHRQDIIDQIGVKLNLAQAAGVRLIHENEHAIFGEAPDQVMDLMNAHKTYVDKGTFGAVFDPGNYVFCGFDPWDAWETTRDVTVHFHIKDWKKGEDKGSIPGEGEGKIPEIIADAVSRNYEGFATLEPHLQGGGPTGGQTGPELFPQAVEAFKKILEGAGAEIE